LKALFEALETTDFESIARFLDDAHRAIPVYGESHVDLARKMGEDTTFLKDLLVNTVAGTHPGLPSEISTSRYAACRTFLEPFLSPGTRGKVYTLNYDLLLYWTVMHDRSEDGRLLTPLDTADGFGRDEFTDPEYVEWLGEVSAAQERRRIHYLHGALHLFDTGSQLVKHTWKNTGVPLVAQTRTEMESGNYPLFVAEGRSDQKLAKIKHSAFLYHSYKSFAAQMNQAKGALYVYGHSLAPNDEHILRKIAKGRIPDVYIGLYGDPSSAANRRIQQAAEGLASARKESDPLNVHFFESTTANVWGSNA
jgi:hypothetical protein